MYKDEMSRGDGSTIFDGVHSALEAVKKYKSLTVKY
jgi:hypothetical protein